MLSQHQRFIVQYLLWGAGFLLMIGLVAGISMYFANPTRDPREVARLAPNPPVAMPPVMAPPDAESILRRLDEAIANNPRNAELHTRRALLLMDARRFREAMADIAEALAINPSQPEALLAKGAIEIMSGKPEDGLRSLDLARAAGADPHHVDLLRAGGLRTIGRFDDAAKIATELVASNPFDDSALILRADIALCQGRFEDALRDTGGAIRVTRSPAPVFVLQGIALVGLGNWKEALASFRGASDLDPTGPAPKLGMATALRALGEPEDADEFFSWARVQLPTELLSDWPESGTPEELARALLRVVNAKTASPAN